MSTHEERCPHCRAKAGSEAAQTVTHEPITAAQLPERPRPFRIHYPDGHVRDYTLHPDGHLTLTAAGQVLATSLSFTFMAETSWADAHIEWDPQLLPDEPAPQAAPRQQALTDTRPADFSYLLSMETPS